MQNNAITDVVHSTYRNLTLTHIQALKHIRNQQRTMVHSTAEKLEVADFIAEKIHRDLISLGLCVDLNLIGSTGTVDNHLSRRQFGPTDPLRDMKQFEERPEYRGPVLVALSEFGKLFCEMQFEEKK